jgi:prepilin-type N-terminal cleavage/methylation domain-containing protein
MIKKILKNKGFTLTEMLVVMGIVGVIMTVVVFNYQDVNSKSILKNVAYDVALSIREVQSLGLGAKKYVSGGVSSFNTPFGAQFNVGEVKYMLFADEDEDNRCDNSNSLCSCPSGECLSEIGSTYRSIELFDTCVSESTGDDPHCLTDGDTDFNSVVFRRPNPDAKIYSDLDLVNGEQLLRIIFKSTKSDDAQMIKVTETGQISVKGCDVSTDYKTLCI